jgi:hypothetical protein
MIVTERDRQDFLRYCRQDPAFFAENVLHDEYGEPYILEDYQREYLRCPAREKLLFWARRLSKSLMIKIECLHKTTFNRAFKAMVVNPSWAQSILWGEELVDIINSTEMIKPMFESTKSTKLKLKNNSRIFSESAGREGKSSVGKGVRYLAFDETQLIAESTFTFLRPTRIGQKIGTDKFLVYAGTPLGRIGEFYEAYSKRGKYYVKRDGIYEPEEPTTGNFIVFERPTAHLDDDGETIIGTGSNRVSIQDMMDEMTALPRTGFLREYCLQFLDQIGEVFSQELINRVVDRTTMPKLTSGRKTIMGLDLGKHRYNSVLTIAELTKKGADIVNIVEWDLETDYYDVIRDIQNVYLQNYPETLELRMDETGVGKAVIETAEREIKDTDVIGFDFSGAKKKKELVEGGVNDLQSGNVSIIYNQRLLNEMLEFRREITEKMNIIYRKPSGGTDDYVDSLLLCLQAARDYHDFTGGGQNEIITTGKRLFDMRTRVRRMIV